MLSVLANRTYRHLFAAQVVSLLGTGLATVALGLLAFELAGANAGAVLGTALAIKMVAYVGVAPIAAAFAERLPRRTILVALDLVRAVVALALPFVTQVWEVYVLIFLLQAASAGFTPTFQATVPDVLADERDYTNALSLSRLAYDLESLISPMLAAALLTVVSFHSLFAGTVLGFLISAALVMTVRLPSPKPAAHRGIWDRTTRGIRLYLATPRLRGLLALNVAVSAAGAMVIVNTVVLVKVRFGLGDREVALALAAFGAGSMLAALTLPRLLDRIYRSYGDAGRRRAPGCRDAGRAVRRRPRQLPATLARCRPRLLADPDPDRAAAAPLGASRRPTGDLRGTVCAVACLLARHLPAGRAPRSGRGPARHLPGHGCAGPSRHSRRAAGLAHARSRSAGPYASRPCSG
jgi:MFS family permease